MAQVFCVMREGLGVPGPAQEVSLHLGGEGRGPVEEAGVWQMASVQGLGEVGSRMAAQRSYLIFWAHFMSSARGFSPVSAWMRSSRRRQKRIFSRG